MSRIEGKELMTSLNLDVHPCNPDIYFRQYMKTDRQIRITNEDTKHGGGGVRSASTAIYAFMQGETFVSWHRHLSDALFLYHKGGDLKVHEITPEGEYRCSILGDRTRGNPEASFQIWMKHDHWYAKELADKSSYVLYTDVVIPGFELEDWHEGSREELHDLFPQHKDIIDRFTPE